MSILHGFYYGFWTFVKHPSRIVTATLFHCTVFLQMIMAMVVISFLEMVLGMRPDEFIPIGNETCKKQFEEYKHLFKITHTQVPSSSLSAVAKDGLPPVSSVLGVKVARDGLYKKVRTSMEAHGLTDSQIRRTSFTTATEAHQQK